VLRRGPDANLDDILEYLRGLGIMIQGIDAKLARIVELLGGDDGEA
jgi:hypothetical protein